MRSRFFTLALLAACLTGAKPLTAGDTATTAPIFHEETKKAGVGSIYAGDWQYMVGGGVATFDCSGDGYPDMLLAGGEATAKFYRNTTRRGGDLHFSEEASGLEIDKVTGAYPLDIDSDGIVDLVLLRVGENVAMRGLGGCRFERANESWGFEGGDGWSTSMAATFERGADWPTIAIGNYVNRYEDMYPWGTCTDNRLHRPAGNGSRTFTPPLALKPSFCPLSMLFTDWDRSGTPSLRISNDREYYKGGQEQLWHIEPGQAPRLYTADEGWKSLRIWGMGIASYDLNFDGYPEYFLTSMADNKLQSLVGLTADGKPKPGYADIAFAKGVTAHRPYTGGDVRPSTAWHTQFEDVNNDGLADLFVAKGNVAEMPDFALRDPNNLLVQGADGKFTEMGEKAGVASFDIARGAALADFNLDGWIDLVVVNRWKTAQIWRNVSAGTGHWIQFDVRQGGTNRAAVGAWIEVKRGETIMRREITVGGGHAGGQAGWHHFGLGDTQTAEVRVIWPDGTAGEWENLGGDAFYVLENGKPATVWSPR